MKHVLKHMLCMLFFLAVPVLCFAQKKIKLTNTKTNKELVLEEGSRVVYTLKNKRGGKIGILNRIQEDSITVGDRTVGLQELSGLGKKKKGSGLGIILMAGFGGSMVGTALAPDPDPCPKCHNVSTTETEGAVVGQALFIGGGLALVGLAMRSATKNSAVNLADGRWKLEITE